MRHFIFSIRFSIKPLSAILICLSVPLLIYPQSDQNEVSEAEYYRNIVRAIGNGNYNEAIILGQKLIQRTNNYEQVYSRIVQAANASGQLEQSSAFFESLLRMSPPNPRGDYGLGLIRAKQKNYDLAIEHYKKCLVAQPQFSLPLLALVDSYQAIKKPDDARLFMEAMMETRRDDPLPHLGLGYFYAKYSQIEKAVNEFDKAMTLSNKMPEICYYRSLALIQDGRRIDSLYSLEKCLPAIEASINEEYQLAFLNLKAVNHMELMNYLEAAKWLNKSLELARSIGDKGYEEVSLGYLGKTYELSGFYPEALSKFQLGYGIAKSSNNQNSITNLNRYPGLIGNIYYLMGDLPTSLEYFQAGLALTMNTDTEKTLAIYLSSIGKVFNAMGQPKQAIAYYNRLTEIQANFANPFSQLFLLDLTYPFYLKIGDYQKAQPAIEQALKLARQLPDAERELRALDYLGELHLRLNEPGKAAEKFSEALRLAQERNSPLYEWSASSGLATAYIKLNQLDKAHDSYLGAIKVMESVRSRLTAEEEKVGFFQDKVKIYKDLIATLIELHGKEAAKGYDAEAFDYAERARGRGFLDLLAEAKVNLDQNLDPALLEKRQIIQNELSKINLELVAERSKELSKQDSSKLRQLEKALSDANEKLDNWVRDVWLSDPRYAALKFPEPIKLPEAEKLLDDRSAMLAYSLSEKESFLFAVTSNDYRVFKLKPSVEIRQSVDDLLNAIQGKGRGNSPMGTFKTSARDLYQSLVEPAKELLAGKTELIVVADESLHRLPFEVLQTAQPNGSWQQLPYLIRDFAISYAPSVSVLAFLKTQPRPATPKDFVAFGDPVFGKDDQLSDQAKLLASTNRSLAAAPVRQGFWRKLFGSFTGGTRGGSTGQLKFDRLPFSRAEATEIAGLFPAGKADLFLGKDATEENAKTKDLLSQYGIVHFSTHGLPNEDRPRFSSLIMSSPTKNQSNSEVVEDGWLSAYEIFNLKLNANLVVLSACETGLGKEVKGEGLMSLTRAFMYAGAPSVVVSLWKVNDAASKDLMVGFYRQLRGGENLSYSQALRRAQLEMISKGNAPKFWAPFVLVGKL